MNIWLLSHLAETALTAFWGVYYAKKEFLHSSVAFPLYSLITLLCLNGYTVSSSRATVMVTWEEIHLSQTVWQWCL